MIHGSTPLMRGVGLLYYTPFSGAEYSLISTDMFHIRRLNVVSALALCEFLYVGSLVLERQI